MGFCYFLLFKELAEGKNIQQSMDVFSEENGARDTMRLKARLLTADQEEPCTKQSYTDNEIMLDFGIRCFSWKIVKIVWENNGPEKKLIAFTAGAAAEQDTKVNFGLMLFPSDAPYKISQYCSFGFPAPKESGQQAEDGEVYGIARAIQIAQEREYSEIDIYYSNIVLKDWQDDDADSLACRQCKAVMEDASQLVSAKLLPVSSADMQFQIFVDQVNWLAAQIK